MKMPLTLEMRGNEDYEIETKLEGTSEPGDELEGTSEPAESNANSTRTSMPREGEGGMLCPRHESTRRSAVGRCEKENDISKEKPDRRKPKKRR